MQVFISYKREDLSFAQQLHSIITSWGFDTWLDVHDMRQGTYWRDEIDTALQKSHIVVGLATPQSLQSRHVLNEWYWALDNQRKLLILKMRECSLNIYHSLSTLNYLDFTNANEAALEHLKRELLNKNSDSRVVTPTQLLARKVASRTLIERLNRIQMINKVEAIWVTDVLENILFDKHSISFDMTPQPDAVLKHMDYGDYKVSPTSTLTEIFRSLDSELLILGDAGSGKTVMLLQLLKELIIQAKEDVKQSIPVIFNLSSWVGARGAIERWVISELKKKYQIPQKVASQWVEKEELICLFDGLDEVALEYRNACVEAINRFRQDYKFIDMIVTSRTNDYQLLTTKLDLQGAVLLQPLTDEQIFAYLDHNSLAGLRETVENYPELKSFAQVPFLLGAMAFTYSNISANLLKPSNKNNFVHEWRIQLLDKYVEAKMRAMPDNGFLPRKTRRYLSYLAKQLIKHNQTLFYIEGMQSDWLQPQLQTKYKIATVLLLGLVVGIVFWVITFIGPLLSSTFLAALTIATSVGVMAAFSSAFTFAFATGIILGKIPEIIPAETLSWDFRWKWLIVGLVVSGAFTPFIGVPMALAGSVAIEIVGGLKASENINLRTRPNQGIWLSVENSIKVWLAIIVLLSLASFSAGGVGMWMDAGIPIWASAGFAGGLIVALISALTFTGGNSIAQHLVLRMFLALQGYSPLNYSKFLDHIAKSGIVRKVGGAYMFSHRYLLEYFDAQSMH